MGLTAKNSSFVWWKQSMASSASSGKKKPEKSVAAAEVAKKTLSDKKKSTGCSKTVCICSPTTHPGSFRCQLHRDTALDPSKKTTQTTAGLSRFARDVSAENNDGSHKPQYNSETE